jgi:hypothetical protein
MEQYLGITHVAFQRLTYFGLIFMIMCHVVSTSWLILARFVSKDFEGTWRINYVNMTSNSSQYMVAFYWTIQTITTVGYGDTAIINNYERMFSQFVMVAGVILFSVANGSLIAIVATLDDSGEYKDKVEVLIDSYKNYAMETRFYLYLH